MSTYSNSEFYDYELKTYQKKCCSYFYIFFFFVIQDDKRTKVDQLNFLKFFVVLTFQEGLSSIV